MEWREHAACRNEDPELFFPITSTGPEHDRQVRAAKDVCERCEVRLPCLEYALAAGEREGIWGGLTELERRRVPASAAARSRARALTG